VGTPAAPLSSVRHCEVPNLGCAQRTSLANVPERRARRQSRVSWPLPRRVSGTDPLSRTGSTADGSVARSSQFCSRGDAAALWASRELCFLSTRSVRSEASGVPDCAERALCRGSPARGRHRDADGLGCRAIGVWRSMGAEHSRRWKAGLSGRERRLLGTTSLRMGGSAAVRAFVTELQSCPSRLRASCASIVGRRRAHLPACLPDDATVKPPGEGDRFGSYVSSSLTARSSTPARVRLPWSAARKWFPMASVKASVLRASTSLGSMTNFANCERR
jgi:hypothetical protein